MSLKIRASNMLRASILADAATMPLHWIYNQADIATKVGTGKAAFFETPSCPFYSYPSGVLSPYGAEALPFLHSIAEEGSFDFSHVAESYFKAMKSYPEESINGYSGRLNHVPKIFIENREKGGKDWTECHVEDSQAQGISKVALIVARYGGHPDLVHQVNQMVDVLQISPISIESSVLLAKLFERILFKHEAPAAAIASLLQDADQVRLSPWQRHLLSFITSETLVGDYVRFAQSLAAIPVPPEDAYRAMRINGKVLSTYFSVSNPGLSFHDALARAQDESSGSDRDVLTEAIQGMAAVNVEIPSGSITQDYLLTVCRALGLSCALPSAILSSLYILRHSDSLENAVEQNVLVGGDNCSRAMVVAAAFAAFSGESDTTILREWETKVQESWWRLASESIEKVMKLNLLLLKKYNKFSLFLFK